MTVVSLLFALALGAITVGLNFNNFTDQALQTTYYDVELFKHDAKVKQHLKQVSIQEKTAFNYKVVNEENNKQVYVSQSQIDRAHLKAQVYTMKNNGYKLYNLNSKTLKNTETNYFVRYQFMNLTPFANTNAKLMLVSQKQFDSLKEPSKRIDLLRVNNFKRDFNKIEALQNSAILPSMRKQKGIGFTPKTKQYQIFLMVASGFEFMGFFLGIAFLAMLASTLMFKVLSGASSDKPRYKMLWKIGTRNSLLKASIAKEIGILFALPAVLGMIDVVFGLQFFKTLLQNPYDKIWIPFLIFLILYLGYYLITVKLYESIVLKRDK